SSAAGPDLSIERLRDDLVEVFERLELVQAVCVGWSMGAMVVWSGLSRDAFEPRVAGLAVIDMTPRLPNDAEWRLGLKGGRDLAAVTASASAMRRDWPGMVERFVPRIVSDAFAMRSQSCVRDMIEDAQALDREAMASLWESMVAQDFRQAIACMEPPMLVCRGDQSRLYAAATSDFIVETAPRAELAAFSQSGHAPHLEEPDAFNARLLNFIDSLELESTKNAPFSMGDAAKGGKGS
ncbi:MAG: alpha/beta hydrolase, partial [Pirellulales bacterium]|nr:alpha/beta hydrolase [Pirellulales bacterium]